MVLDILSTFAIAGEFDLGARTVRQILTELMRDYDVTVEDRLFHGREATREVGTEVHSVGPCHEIHNACTYTTTRSEG